MRLVLLDECISPRMVRLLWAKGVDVVHVRDRDMLEADDHVIWQYAQEQGRAVVTINKGDFRKLAGATKAHAGVIIIPSGGNMEAQLAWLEAALDWITTSNTGEGFLNRYIEVNENGDIVCAEIVTAEE